MNGNTGTARALDKITRITPTRRAWQSRLTRRAPPAECPVLFRFQVAYLEPAGRW
jgi:hypothetical protein